MSRYLLAAEDFVYIDNNILTPYVKGPPAPDDTNATLSQKLQMPHYMKVQRLLAFVKKTQLITSELLELEAVSGMRRQRVDALVSGAPNPHFIAMLDEQIRLLESILARSNSQGISGQLVTSARLEVEKYPMGTIDALHVATVAAAKERHVGGRRRKKGRSARQVAAEAVFVTGEVSLRGGRRRTNPAGRQQHVLRGLFRTELARGVRLPDLDIPA